MIPPVIRFTTVDPGLPGSGYACWERQGNIAASVDEPMRCHYRLRHCGLVRADLGANKRTGVVPRINIQEHLLRTKLFDLGWDGWPVVGERMRHRPMPRFTKGKKRAYIDPQDLINLNLLSGRLATLWLEPSEWKGTSKAEDEQSQSEAVLDEQELALVMAVMPDGRRKEAWSAVGIGLSIVCRAHKCIGWGNWT